MADEAKTPDYDAFTILERKRQDPFWQKCGAGWKTKSGDGIVLQLNSLPLDGRLTLLPYKPPEKKGD